MQQSNESQVRKRNKHDSQYPEFVCISVGEHWIRCGQEFGSNYVILADTSDDPLIVDDPKDAKCTVCGKSALINVPCLVKD